MHEEQIEWCVELKKKFPSHFANKRVLDIGSLDINGNNKYLFDNCEYIGLDVLPGKNVDVVSVAHEYPAADETFDVVLSTNALEHDIHYTLTLKKMVALLKPGGFMFISACHSHPEHGTLSHHPGLSATVQLGGEWATFYKSFSEKDISGTLNLAEIFSQYELRIKGQDLQFWGVKKERTEAQSVSTSEVEKYPFPMFVYSSSPDRGLDTLLCLFPFIRREFPEATLHVLYGFDNWNKSIDQRNNEQEKKWRDQILKDMKQPGVYYHGRVNQNVVAKMYQAADIWFYPTRFTETYCITALEAQMAKTVCVCTDLAALHTTVGDRGILLQGDAYTSEYREQALKEVFAILKDNRRRQEIVDRAYEWARQQTWEARAKEWFGLFE